MCRNTGNPSRNAMWPKQGVAGSDRRFRQTGVEAGGPVTMKCGGVVTPGVVATRRDRVMRALCVGFMVVAFVGVACGQEKKAATIKITLPESSFKDTIVKVDGVEVKGTGETRTFTTPALEPGKEY